MMVALVGILIIVEFDTKIVNGEQITLFENHSAFFSFLLSIISLFIAVVTIYFLRKTSKQTQEQITLLRNAENQKEIDRREKYISVLDVKIDPKYSCVDFPEFNVQRGFLEIKNLSDGHIHDIKGTMLIQKMPYPIRYPMLNKNSSFLLNLHHELSYLDDKHLNCLFISIQYKDYLNNTYYLVCTYNLMIFEEENERFEAAHLADYILFRKLNGKSRATPLIVKDKLLNQYTADELAEVYLYHFSGNDTDAS